MKKILSGLLTFAMLSATVSAAEVDITRNVDNASFHIKGTAEPQSCLTVDVYAPGKDIEDLMKAENLPFDIVKYHNEFYADVDGSFEFDIKLADNSGLYKTYLTADGEMLEFDLEFINGELNLPLIDELNKVSDIESFIESDDNRNNLGFFFDLYDEVNKEKVASFMKEMLPAENAEHAVDIFQEAVIITALSDEVISGILEYKDKLAILETERYKNRYSEQAEGIDERIGGRKFDTVEEFEKALGEALVLEVIENPNGYKNIQNAIKDFEDETGIENPTNKESVYKKLSGNSYDSYADLKKAYNKYLSDGETKGGSGGSSGGGGKGGAGNASIYIPVDETPTPITTQKQYFTDMENTKWAEEAVNYLAEKGIVAGRNEGEFCPSDTIKREEFVTMIVNAFGLKKYVDTNEFEDVTKDSWFYDAVMAASQNGIVSGVSKNSFGSGALITRQDMSVILYRVANAKNIAIKSVHEAAVFTDDSQIAEYAKDAVGLLQMGGIINGMNDGSFAPENSATRAQAAVMLYRLIAGQK